ncbi:MAG TPA: sigma factor-like helix-turn-helix DNA-binding protein, partial [Candidatus Ozemobacteraceae bacterium]|nr:sigma factor-like helix-turn-helix DNA-binding protein [Candidatus Ozemobacteraceae bacterium]
RFRKNQIESANTTVSQECLERVQSPSPKSDPAVHVELHEEFRRTFQDILTLPEELRAPLILRVLQELPYEEIAEILDLPLQTVKNRIFKARQALRGKRDATHVM